MPCKELSLDVSLWSTVGDLPFDHLCAAASFRIPTMKDWFPFVSSLWGVSMVYINIYVSSN